MRKNYSDEFAILKLPTTSLFNVLEFLGRKSLWQIRDASDRNNVFDDLEKLLMNDSSSEMNTNDIDLKAFDKIYSDISGDI